MPRLSHTVSQSCARSLAKFLPDAARGVIYLEKLAQLIAIKDDVPFDATEFTAAVSGMGNFLTELPIDVKLPADYESEAGEEDSVTDL